MKNQMGKYLKDNGTILSTAKQKISEIFFRKFHSYCLGAEKTGTTSIHQIFDKNFRSDHEPDAQHTLPLVIDYLEGKISEKEVKDILKKRDKRLNLEMEATHPLIYVSHILVDIFPEAKFIITIREPYSQLSSRINWQLSHEYKVWKPYLLYFFAKKHHGFEPEERILEEKKLFSLDTFLSHYADHYKRVETDIPENRRIVIRTDELNNSLENISSFFGVDKSSLSVSHANTNHEKVKILDELDEVFVRKKIWYHCSDIIKKYFPGTLSFYEF